MQQDEGALSWGKKLPSTRVFRPGEDLVSPSLLREATECHPERRRREGSAFLKQILRSRACRALAQDDSAARLGWRKKLAPPQLNRVVRQSHQPVPESSASMVAVRPTTHPQPMVNWGTRATTPKPMNVAVAPPTRSQSSQVRRPGAAPALSPARAARTYAGSML